MRSLTRLRGSVVKLGSSTARYVKALVALNVVLIVLAIPLLLPVAKEFTLWPFNRSIPVTQSGASGVPAAIGTPNIPPSATSASGAAASPGGAVAQPTPPPTSPRSIWFSTVVVPALLGAIGSLLVAWYYDYATSPRLKLRPDESPRQTGQRPGEAQYQFLQIKVKQEKGYWPFVSRRVAWNCRATMEVFTPDGSKPIPGSVTARWSGSLQPYRTQLIGQQLAQIPDSSLFPLGERFDVYSYSEEQIGIAVKFGGGEDCWIFSNESYLYSWRNPAWQLPRGQYFIRFQLYYESKAPATRWLSLVNNGDRFEDWSVSLVDRIPF